MNDLQKQQESAVGVLDKPATTRPAWILLQAEHSNSKGITRDRWRLLSAAFENIPDDVLNLAVLSHMKESPFFPRMSDLNKQIQLIVPKTPFGEFCDSMLKIKFLLKSDVDGTAVFSDGIQNAFVRH